jgi:nucleoside-diphosphate-sugar epimerase
MSNKDVSILITGASGLVGSYLILHLVRKGYSNIRALHRKDSNLELLESIKDRINWIEGDICNYYDVEQAMNGVSQVYHCAAIVSYDSRDYNYIMQTNVEGTENIVNAALELKIDKLVHVSSTAAIGKDKNKSVLDENAKWSRNPDLSSYAISKYLSEQMVWRGWAEGLKVAIVNPSIIIGAGNWSRSSAKLFLQVWNGLKFYPLGSTGFVDIRDVVAFMHLIMESDINGERYVLSAENLSFKTVFEKIANGLGKKIPQIAVNPFLRELSWRIEWLRSRISGKKVLITKETARLSAQNSVYDNSKSKQIQGFMYRKIDKSIRDTAKNMNESASNNWKLKPLPFD